ncbi:hypothetical protein [Paenibacillus sp. FSL K6-2862]|uniref:hypothetical protein n=1 Tax=Paenibacillus sp. FSL K6-2862 TaxID=2921484 RepID=UPI0030F538F6
MTTMGARYLFRKAVLSLIAHTSFIAALVLEILDSESMADFSATTSTPELVFMTNRQL